MFLQPKLLHEISRPSTTKLYIHNKPKNASKFNQRNKSLNSVKNMATGVDSITTKAVRAMVKLMSE